MILDVDFSTKIKPKNTSTYKVAGVATLGESLWGASYWAGGQVASRSARFTKMNGLKVALKVTHVYSYKYEIHPFQIEYFPKELVRFPSKIATGAGEAITFGGEAITW